MVYYQVIKTRSFELVCRPDYTPLGCHVFDITRVQFIMLYAKTNRIGAVLDANQFHFTYDKLS